jgi:hypothetical protein
MPTPEAFDQDSACDSPGGPVQSQSRRGLVALDGEGWIGLRSSSSSLSETQAHRRALERTRRRILEELREIREALFYLSWKEHVPAHEVRPLGAALAQLLAARGKHFHGEHRDLNLGIAFLHLVAVDMTAFLRLAI